MTTENIIRAVRLCYDEEATNASSLVTSLGYADDKTLMDNIIKSHIADALRWVCLYAPAELLGGSDEKDSQQRPVSTGVLTDITPTPTAISGGGGSISLPADFIKLARVRVEGWHRAVIAPLEEDSDEYLQLYDTNGACATADRPQAALIDAATRRLEVWPWQEGQQVELTYVSEGEPVAITSSQGGATTVTAYALPPKAKTAIVYYIAFLTLHAYGDARAEKMLEIAKMNIAK